MDCKDVKEKLAAYLDGELDGVLTRDVAEHLDKCAGCRWEMGKMESVWELLDGYEVPDAPEDLPRKVMDSISSGKGAAGGALSWGRMAAWPMNAMAVASIVVGIFFGIFLGNSYITGRTDSVDRVYEVVVDENDEDFFSELPSGSLAWCLMESVSVKDQDGEEIEEDAK